MIPVAAISAMYSLAGHGLSENAEKREWSGALLQRVSAQRSVRTGRASPLVRTAALVKQSPLPVGRYWIDVFEDGIPAWIGWSGGNLATISIEKTEFYKGTSKVLEVLGWIYPWVPGDNTVIPDRAFIIFNVNSPTVWGIENEVGWPNTAPANIKTSDDTVTKPTAEDTLPWWQGGNQGLPAVKVALGAVGIAAGVIAVSYVFRSFK